MKSCHNPSSRRLSSEIATRHFGRRVAMARRDPGGRISCYLVPIDADLFTAKLGPNILASVMDGQRWFDIARLGGTYRVRSQAQNVLLQGSETLHSQAHHRPQCFRVWHDTSVVYESMLPRPTLLSPAAHLEDLLFVAGAFSEALDRCQHHHENTLGVTTTAVTEPARKTLPTHVKNRPLLIVPETQKSVCQGFSRSLVLLQ
jgi:hypothetical protein